MASTGRSGKWSSDYSFLLNTIEGELDGVKPAAAPSASTVAAKASVIVTNHTGVEASAVKRKRVADILSDDFEELNKPSVVKKESASTSLKLKAENDELKLTNEQLREQLKAYKYEHELFKEQTIRQLSYIEQQNTRLKTECEQKSNKYYDEKKKWQGKVRELEAQLQALKGGDQLPCPIARAGSRAATVGDAESDSMRVKMLDLERRLGEQAVELHRVTKEKLELEKTTIALDAEKRSYATCYQGMTVQELMTAYQNLKKDFEDSTFKLHRKTKEVERLDKAIKNQSILEEEHSALKFKLSLMEETLKQAKSAEQELSDLKENVHTWTSIFRKVMLEHEKMTKGGSQGHAELRVENEHGLVSPAAALHLLHEYQHKCVLQLAEKQALETRCAEVSDALDAARKELQEGAGRSAGALGSVAQLEGRNALLLKRNRLFENEISSLRKLLQTYDMEFNIGKPEADKMIAMKEEVITELRDEVDKTRAQAQQWADQVMALEDALRQGTAVGAPVPEDAGTASSEVAALVQALEDARGDYAALQEITGMDHLPHKTRVLRLADNPLDLTRGRTGNSSLPSDELRRLRLENRALLASQHDQSAAPPLTASASIDPTDTDAPPSTFAHHNQSMDMNVSVLHTTFSGPDQGKLNQRLKEMFKEKISTFREAVYIITGFKIDMLPQSGEGENLPRIRLRSMYAEQAEDCLMFQLRGGGAELLETEFAARLSPELLQMLQTSHSVPAFLSNLTLELFESQTFMG